MSVSRPIVIIEDEEECRISYTTVLELEGYGPVVACQDSREAMRLLASHPGRLVLLDLMMPHLTGEELLPRITETYPEMPVIVITGNDDTDMAVRCIKNGAHDYLVKPITKNRLITTIQHALDFYLLNQEIRSLHPAFPKEEERLKHPQAFRHIITANKNMRDIFTYLERIAGSPANLLIEGETGTGKELFAQAVHSLSGRSGEFFAVNVAGLDDSAFSDTLFGHIRGAYTGADKERPGILEQATGGTLLLDEVGDLSRTSQLKILRLLQSGEYYKLGSDTPLHASVRIIAATNQNLAVRCHENTFRKDLYYRLCTHRITLPPLRNRLDDIPLLVSHFAEKTAAELQRKVPKIPGSLHAFLQAYSFPGNIRELEAMVTNAVSCATGETLEFDSFQEYFADAPGEKQESAVIGNRGCMFENIPILPTVSDVKAQLIEEALQRTEGNQSQAARLIGITQQTVSRYQQTRAK